MDDDQETTLSGEKLVYNVAEVAKLLGLGKTSAWEAIWRGEIPHLKIGRRVLIPREALEKFLAQAGSRNKNGQG
jgi:excisionase family DNA binding protein